jgi:hypothetical protein
MKCKKCGREIGKIISRAVEQLTPLRLEFACPDCIEKVAKSNAITLDSETSWGKVMAELKGRQSACDHKADVVQVGFAQKQITRLMIGRTVFRMSAFTAKRTLHWQLRPGLT